MLGSAPGAVPDATRARPERFPRPALLGFRHVTNSAAAEMAKKYGLSRMGARPPLGRYLAEAWRRRYFAITLSRYTVEAGDSDSRLGSLWVIVRPFLSAVIYGLLFGVILGPDRPHNFVPHLLVGVTTFEFFAKCFDQGAKSITGNQSLVTSLAFPRILLPISAVLRNIFELWPMWVVLVLALLAFQQWPSWNWLLVIPMLGLMTLLNTGLALISARLTVHFRDLSQIIPFINRLLFYGSGIFFTLQSVTKNQTLIHLFQINPVYDFVEAMHSFLLPGYEPLTQWEWTALIGWSVLLPVIGLLFFWSAEERYGRVE